MKRPRSGRLQAMVMHMAALCLIASWGAAPALAQLAKMSGQVVDFNKELGTCELEVQQGGGGFTTLHLDHEAMWVLKKMEVGDFLEATVVTENGKLVAKEVALRIGPFPEIDLLQGVISKINHRDHSIEVKIQPGGKEEVLFFDPSSYSALGEVKVGERVEARVETVMEKQGPKRVIRVLVRGMGQ